MTTTIDRAAIETVVREVLAELAPATRGKVSSTDLLGRDLGLDSLQNMELLSRLSEHFDIDPEMEEVMDVETVADVVTFLLGYIEA
jgi:acyl carrier protein